MDTATVDALLNSKFTNAYLNVIVDKTSVSLPGPPPVVSQTNGKSWKVQIKSNKATPYITGFS